MYIDFKITTWERVKIPKYLEDEVLNKIISKKIKTADDVFTMTNDYKNELSCDILEVKKQMIPKENNNQATIEVYENKFSSPIWKNDK